MKKWKKKQVIYVILILLWMLIIFCFSHQQGNESEQTSKGIVINILNMITRNLKIENKQEIIFIVDAIIRKLAHYTIYILGGILITGFVKTLSIKTKQVVIYSILIGAIYASSDEIHQLFVPGRSGKITDVLIDTIGVATGICIYMLLSQVISIHKQKKLQDNRG